MVTKTGQEVVYEEEVFVNGNPLQRKRCGKVLQNFADYVIVELRSERIVYRDQICRRLGADRKKSAPAALLGALLCALCLNACGIKYAETVIGSTEFLKEVNRGQRFVLEDYTEQERQALKRLVSSK